MSSSTNSRGKHLQFEWQGEKSVFSVDDSPLTIGRLDRCDVTVNSDLVSRKHLLLLWDGDQWSVTDTSVNGAFGDDKMPEQWVLESSVKIKLGAADGPTLSIVLISNDVVLPVDSEVEREIDPTGDVEAASGGSSDEVVDLRSDVFSSEGFVESGDTAEREIMAKSTVTQPIKDTQVRSSFPRPRFAASTQLRSRARLNKTVDSDDMQTKGPLGLGKDSDPTPIEGNEGRSGGSLKSESAQTNQDDDLVLHDTQDAGSNGAVFGDRSIDDGDLPEPRVTGTYNLDGVEIEMEPQAKGPEDIPATDSLAAKVRTATVVIASAVVAFGVWALIKLLM